MVDLAVLTTGVAIVLGLVVVVRRARRPPATTKETPWKSAGDPALATDVHPLKMVIMMAIWAVVCEFSRFIARLLFHRTCRCFYDVAESPGVEVPWRIGVMVGVPAALKVRVSVA